MKAYKIARPDGTDFRTGTVAYTVGATVSVANPDPPEAGPCGRGLHVSPRVLDAVQYANSGIRPWRFFEVEIADGDILAKDSSKLRVKTLTVTREMPLEEVVGPGLLPRLEALKAEAATWKAIPWLKPDHVVTEDEVRPLLAQWHEAISPWLRKGTPPLPRRALLVRDRQTAEKYAAADADAAAADADAAAAAAAADAAAADDYYRLWPYWAYRWYVRPRYALYRMARWACWMGDRPNPWAPIVALFRLGCAPIGYVTTDDGPQFLVYVPEVRTP